MAEKERWLETWSGYYLLVEEKGAGWTIEAYPCGTGVTPGDRGPVDQFKGKSLEAVRKTARDAVSKLKRP